MASSSAVPAAPALTQRPSAEELSSVQLRRSVRRPSESDDLDALVASPNATKNRFVRRELSITHSGWLTKLSRGGLPNWNRRWFILIGGSLYYSRSAAASASDLHIFAEMLHVVSVELVTEKQNGAAHQYQFKLRMGEAEPTPDLLFSAPSNDARLTWMAHLEQAIGMQPVSSAILLAEMRREAESADGGLRLQVVSTELHEREAELQAARRREEELRHLVAQLQRALSDKDQQLWQMALAMEGKAPTPTITAVAPQLMAGGNKPVPPAAAAGPSAAANSTSAAATAPSEATMAAVAAPASAAAVPSSSSSSSSSLALAARPPPVDPSFERMMQQGGLQAVGQRYTSGPVSVPMSPAAAGPVVPPIAVPGSSGAPSPSAAAADDKAPAADKGAAAAAAKAPRRGSLARIASVLSPRGGMNRAHTQQISSKDVTRNGNANGTGGGAASPAASPPSDGATAAAAPPKSGKGQGRRWSAPTVAEALTLAPLRRGSTAHAAPAAAGTPAAADDDDESGEIALLTLLRQGSLTKLSKGGFTANWNRRSFALIGSTLFYAKDRGTLLVQPKVFAQIAGCDVRPWNADGTGHNHVFAICLPAEEGEASPGGGGAADGAFEMLLLAADTPRDKHAWIEALLRGSRLPRCPVDKVAPTLSLQMYGGCQDLTVNSVLQADADPLLARGGGGGAPTTIEQQLNKGRSDGPSHAGYMRRERSSLTAAERLHRQGTLYGMSMTGAPEVSRAGSSSTSALNSSDGFFSFEKWLPLGDVLRNV